MSSLSHLAVNIADATKWASIFNASYSATPAPDNIRYRGWYYDHHPMTDKELSVLAETHLLKVTATLNQAKDWTFLGYLAFYARASGSGHNARIYSHPLNFGEQIIVVPRIGADFKMSIEGIRPWIKGFSINISAYDSDPIAIEEAKLLALESELIEINATLETIAGLLPPGP
jgi:hypothetical protein